MHAAVVFVVTAANVLAIGLVAALVVAVGVAGSANWPKCWPGRILRRPVAWLGGNIALYLPATTRDRLGLRIAHAGLDPAPNPAQWLAFRLQIAVLAAVAAAGMTKLLGMEAARGLVVGLAFGTWLPLAWLGGRIRQCRQAIFKALPGYLDLLVLALEAGCGFSAALELSIERSPHGPLKELMRAALDEMRAGRNRSQALRRLEEHTGVPQLAALVTAVAQADATGASLAPVLRSQSERCLQERFALAEKRSMEAPVKMLGPLIACIFPCTFLVVGFPIFVRLSGMLE